MEKDYLTGALDRHGLYEWYGSLKKYTILQFMFLDLDNFKMVNDTYGHSTGDELLIAVAKILETCMEQATCVRLAGDEFVVVITGRVKREKVVAAAESINNRIQQKEGFSNIDTDVSASIGILLNQSSSEPLNEILFKIDAAMYQAKGNGKACYVVFNDIADNVYNEVMMEQHQLEALENNEFEIYYKPVINSQTSRLVMSEARIIWNMADGTKKQQEEFIHLFERNGFIRELNLWAFMEVCKHISKFKKRKTVRATVGIRISKILFGEKNLSEELEVIMGIYGIEKKDVCLEAEEKIFLRGSEKMVSAIKVLQEKGFSTAVINVGVEFTSIKYWDKLYFDYIIFDAYYLKGALKSSRGKMVIKTLFSIGNELNVRVVADGISKKEDVIFLGGCGCVAVSGEYYSKPLPAKEYNLYVDGKLAYGRKETEFRFLNGFLSSDGECKGIVIGNVKLEKGISSQWGSVYFPGGHAMENVIIIPPLVLSEPSYTIGMWLKPELTSSWSSSIYARYIGGFMSHSPFVIGGNSVFRISEDSDLNGWHDVFSRQIHINKWSFVCMTYDSGVSRYYINGRKCGYKPDIPLLPVCKQIIAGGDPFQDSYKGYMSALIFYDNAMSEDEIKEWYHSFLSEDGFQGAEETFWDLEDSSTIFH